MISLGLIGFPLTYSLSPQLHRAALDAVGLSGDYSLFPIPPLPQGESMLRALIARLRIGDFKGLNVTIPHKQTVIPYLDNLTTTARDIGAVNTIYREKGRLIGDNTDKSGFLIDLENFMGGYIKTKEREENAQKGALILGAGGAARAVAYALIHTGWDVIIAARRFNQAEELVNSLKVNINKVQFTDHDLLMANRTDHTPALGDNLLAITLNKSSITNLYSETFNQETTVIVNATPVGTWPEVYSTPWPFETPFPKEAYLYDLIYNPPETEMMRQASQAHIPVTNGLGMLIEQAALSFEIWTGCSVPRQFMWQAASEYTSQSVNMHPPKPLES